MFIILELEKEMKEIQDQVNDIHLKKFNAKPEESTCQGCDYKNVCSFKSEIK
jgi:radical SAM protein with 4Fe4S-binding SPASM domain